MSLLGAVVRRGLAAIGALFVLSFVAAPFAVQSLPMAQVTVRGVVDAPLAQPVTVTVRRSGSYGLTARERSDGWEPLNKPVAQDVVLAERFDATLPPASYCVTRPIWAKAPPPPVVLTLSFSDAPDEHYNVVKTGRGTTYWVADTNGLDIAPERAAWRLTVGELTQEAAGYPSRWWIDLRVERNPQPPRDGAAAA